MANNSYGWASPPSPQQQVTNPNMRAANNTGLGNGQLQGQGFEGDPPPNTGRTRVDDGGPTYPSYNGTNGANSYLDTIAGMSGMLSPGNWTGDFAGTHGSYMNNFFTPYVNAMNAAEAQRYNEFNSNQNFGEQQRVNTGQMDLANRGSNREDLALKYGQANNTRDFGEQARQFNSQYGLADRTQKNTYDLGQSQNANARFNYQNQLELGKGQLKNDAFANRTNLTNVQNQLSLGQGQNRNQAREIANTYNLGNDANANARFNYQNQLELGMGQNKNQANDIANQLTLGNDANANTRYNYQNQLSLGQGQNKNQANDIANQLALGNAANANTRYNYQNQLNLGQGQLGFQNRELDTTNQFNRRKLNQDAALTREGYKNDAMNQRYATFGRAQAANPRAALSWH